MIAAAIRSVVATITTPMAFGRMCLKMMRDVGCARDAGRLDELPLPQREELRPHETGDAGPREESEEEREERAVPRPPTAEPTTAPIDDDRDDDDDVGEPHQHGIHPAAVVPGDRADHDADEGRDAADDEHDVCRVHDEPRITIAK